MRLFVSLFLLIIAAHEVHAAETILPISVKLVQCGPTIEKACERDSRCCALLQGYEIAEIENNPLNQSTPADFIAAQNQEIIVDLTGNSRTQILQ